jgi:hypothetical protein
MLPPGMAKYLAPGGYAPVTQALPAPAAPAPKPRKKPAAAAAAAAPAESENVAALRRAFGGGAAQEREEREDAQAAAREMLPPGMQGLVKNRRGGPSYANWVEDVSTLLERGGYHFGEAQAEYWRHLYQAGFSASEAAHEFEATWLAERGYAGNQRKLVANWDEAVQRHFGLSVGDVALFHGSQRVRIKSMRRVPGGVAADVVAIDRVPGVNLTEWTTAADNLQPVSGYEENARRPPPPPSSKPFDPSAPRESYTKPHHFAVNMDPDAALARYWSAIEDGDIAEAREAKGDLMNWIERGGFEPDWVASGHSRQEFQALTGASMRARHGSPHGLTENRRPQTPRQMYRHEVAESLKMAGVPEYTAYSMVDGDHREFMLASFQNRDNPEIVAHHILEQERAASQERGYGWGTTPNLAPSGSWRIQLAGRDIDPQPFAHFTEAQTYAQEKYGPSGWTVEWHSGAG